PGRDPGQPARRTQCARPRRRGDAGGGHRGRDDGRGRSMTTYRRMLRYLRPHVWPYGILAVVFMLAFSALESSIPFLITFTFDQVFTKQGADMLHLAVVAALGLSSVRGGVGFVADYLNDWIGQRVVTDMRNELTAHMQDLDVAFFNRQRAGQIVS